jgi:hypothetical protein
MKRRFIDIHLHGYTVRAMGKTLDSRLGMDALQTAL